MLNQIIFILSLECPVHARNIAAEVRLFRQYVQGEGVSVCYLYDVLSDTLPLEDAEGANQKEIEAEKTRIIEWNQQNTLYLTDSPEVLNHLLDTGYYAIALRHEGNPDADLSRALYEMMEIKDIGLDSFVKAYERLAGLPWHIADTARLTLRETTVADVDEFYRIYQDASITQYMEALYPDIGEEKGYAEDYINQIYGFYGYGIWTVVLRETGEVIGRAGISWREGFHYPELGFVIAREHQRQGYAEEVCREILRFAWAELGFVFVQALVEPGNKASLDLCDKLGFEYRESITLKEREHIRLVKDLSKR